ncbi:hypothetical protein [Mycobacteroides immunogenum]|uniref:Uncharacterized protein n=1 Tax=Mycobacteroides immunogenum TaxID=83262 RepID=A0A7V8RXQ8_9MYCO|nr:hypothetical protein [Mycobacteroides immunogenum]AMT72033.1 hypothetical protein ABG82_18805 [Mycobacteroides immunogenum]ANO05163.1 hypothetical protein BAB75_19075 [Mycobacteroides immunogenum]KIU40166.1 hypothetical protein TL11_12875 [Mycobacteroides immunogenum]KPG13665.1 hypothetical protein AN909_05150 [Mycobacteroides immunogenum]KPG14414.1 hypothetical protein AN908_07715 [Mycobacteroides immunogenum]
MSELDWAVQWEAATPDPEILANKPEPPDLIGNAGSEAENASIRAQYVEALSAHEALIDADLVNPQRWQSVRSVAADEDDARRLLGELRRLHAANPLTRNFQLATSPRREWTVTE